MGKSTMIRDMSRSLSRRDGPTPRDPSLVDYFAVCGLSTVTRRVEGEGRFHTISTRESWGDPFLPQLIDRYPLCDSKAMELPQMLPSVLLPYGVRIYPSGPSPEDPDSMPHVFPAILTNTKGDKIYVAALKFRDRVDDFLVRSHKLAGAKEWYADKCICIVSHLPNLRTFQQILSHMHRACFTAPGCSVSMWSLIEELTKVPVPSSPLKIFNFPFIDGSYKSEIPQPGCPRLPHVSYQALVESLGIDGILWLFCAALTERKILITGCHVALLTDVAEALVSLLWPLKWMPVYVPLLPVDALECLDAPVTYIYGVCTSDVEVHVAELDRVMVADLDKGTVEMVYYDGHKPDPGKLDYTIDGVPELPKGPAKKLRRTLTNLIKPRVSTMMAVPHALSVRDAGDLDREVGTSNERWGPLHNQRFQLAFMRFMAEVLKGWEGYVVGEDVDATFKAEQFIAAKKEEFGADARNFFSLLLCTCTWQQFLTDEATQEGSFNRSFDLNEFMAALVADAKAPVEYLGGGEELVELSRGSFRPLPPRFTAEPWDTNAESQVHSHFPESESCKLAEAREKDAKQRMMRLDTLKAEEEEARKEMLKLSSMAKMHHHLDILMGSADSSDSAAAMKQLMTPDLPEDEALLIECFVTCLTERFETKTEVSPAFFSLCNELVQTALEEVEQTDDFATAAQFLEITGKIVLKDGDCLRKSLRGLGIWEDRMLWEFAFQQALENWEDGQMKAPEEKLRVMQDLVGTMVDVGVPMADMGQILEQLSGSLSIKSQILLRDQFLQLQVLINPQARKFMSMMEKGGFGKSKGPSKARSQLPLSKSAKQWAMAVGKVKESSNTPQRSKSGGAPPAPVEVA